VDTENDLNAYGKENIGSINIIIEEKENIGSF
jgi:hypothetical protein